MSPLPATILFWLAVACCLVAQTLIVRSVLAARALPAVPLGLAAVLTTGACTSASPAPGADPSASLSQVALARSHIKHVIFLIKENRTFDTLFGRFPGAVTARWYNPTDARYRAIPGVPLPNRGSHTFRTPGDNGTKTNDWLLILEVR